MKGNQQQDKNDLPLKRWQKAPACLQRKWLVLQRIAAVKRVPAWELIVLGVISCAELVEVVLHVAERILHLIVQVLVRLLPHLMVFGKGLVLIIRCCLHVFRLAWLSLCFQCIASGFSEGAVCFGHRGLLIGWLARVHDRCALSAERCPSVLLPSRASLIAEGESRTSACVCSRLCSSVFPGCSGRRSSSARLLPEILLRFVLRSQVDHKSRRRWSVT